MYLEAVTARLQVGGSQVLEADERDLADVVLVWCDTAPDWEVLADVLPNPAVAVLPSFDIDGFIRALRAGAGVVHIATSSELVVATAEAVVQGEVLLPIALAQRLAAQSATRDEVDAFTEIERILIGAIGRGKTIAEIVEQVHYSDRTIRRRLQGLYVKLDVHSRGEAIEKIRLEGLGDC
jgi:DNA-binding NarL/FixJ family response regulator